MWIKTAACGLVWDAVTCPVSALYRLQSSLHLTVEEINVQFVLRVALFTQYIHVYVYVTTSECKVMDPIYVLNTEVTLC